MSHQSLKDLTDVTGSPSDGQTLKYNSGAWAPADDSSGAQYIEFFDDSPRFDPASPYYPGILIWFPDSAVTHDSIPSGEIVKFEDISDKSGFNSMWGTNHNHTRWIKASNTAKYYINVIIWVRYANSTFSPNYLWLGKNLENQMYNAETPESNVRVFVEEVKRFTGVTSQNIDGSDIDMITTAGTYAKIQMRFTYSADTAKWSYPQLKTFIDSSASIGGILGSGTYLASGATQIYAYNRYLRITKIA
jgi:hypothetical protein